jgi:general secretion pathway protein I
MMRPPRFEDRRGIASHLRAFTLLEVMVAVSILGLGLVVLLTAQTGLFSSAKRAATLSQAVGLARCKMSEIEEQLLRNGYSITGEDEEGPCCEDEESELRCKWSIIPIVLPELGAGGPGGADAGAGMEGEEPTASASLDVLGNASEQLSQGNTSDALSGLNGAVGAASGGPSMGAGALAPLAMGMIYPQLKGMLEASIRKITVHVVWSEGPVEREFSVTQYVTNPQQGGLLDVDESAGAAGAPGTGASGTGLPTNGSGRSSQSNRQP